MTVKTRVEERARAIERLDERIGTWRFRPHPAIANGHLQTIAGALWRRRFSRAILEAEEVVVALDHETSLLARCSWQPERLERPTLLLVHGLEGSDASSYMLGTASKAHGAGWNVVRLNVRNCGGTEHMTPTLYHSGMSGDVAAVVEYLAESEQLDRIAVAGFSLGGNMVLKMAGEWGHDAPAALLGVAVVSPAIDLSASAAALERSSNVVYHKRFVWSLRDRMLRKDALFPDRYDTSLLRGARTIRDYDTRYIAPIFGFRDAEDYYDRASAIHTIDRVAVPTLVLHAADDPFIPFTPRVEAALGANPSVRSIVTARGGHVGFVAADPGRGEDRYWAENRLVEFFSLLSYTPAVFPS